MEAVLADVLVVIHFFIVAFCVLGELAILLGGAFKWPWVRKLSFRLAHLGTVLFVAVQAIFGALCPLTEWEYDLRRAAGQQYEEDMSFLARIVRSLVYYDFPPWFFTILYVGFGAAVLLTFIFIKPVRKKKA